MYLHGAQQCAAPLGPSHSALVLLPVFVYGLFFSTTLGLEGAGKTVPSGYGGDRLR